MRTVFENTNETATSEEVKSSAIPVVLWLTAILFVVGVFAVYQKVSKRAIPAPPPPVSLRSPKQVNRFFYEFNELVRNQKWDEANQLLSAGAKQRLADSKMTLHDALLEQRKGKDDKVLRGEPSPEQPENQPDYIKQNNIYFFEKNETIYVPLTVVKETIDGKDRLAIDNWK